MPNLAAIYVSVSLYNTLRGNDNTTFSNSLARILWDKG